MNKSRFAIIVALAALGGGRPASAQWFNQPMYTGGGENMEGFTVSGKAFSSAKPNSVEIDLEVSAASELTADAIVKYRDAKKRIHDAFTALKLKNIGVDERGLLVDQKGQMQNPYFWGGMPNTRMKSEVQLTRKLVVRATDIRSMDEDGVLQLVGKLLDVAQDSGGKVGPQNNWNPYYYNPWQNMQSGLVRFVLDDFDKLQEEAYEKAIADARARAVRLARLSKVELGPIVAVREVMVPSDRVMNMMGSDEEMPRKRLEVSRFQEIPIRVELLVRFSIVSKSNTK
jgi:uncharacterized protein YggE